MKTKLLPLIISVRIGIYLLVFGAPYMGVSQIKFVKATGGDLFPVTNGKVLVADIEGDGDPDILIQGESYHSTTIRDVKLFLNDGKGKFEEKIDVPFPMVSRGAIAFGDINSDGLPDLFLSGASGSAITTVSMVYKNLGNGIFEEINVPALIPVYNSDAVFADLNGDNTEDLLIFGLKRDLGYSIQLFSNDGQGNFSEVEHNFTSVNYPSIETADIDGDGDIDIAITGTGRTSNPSSRIYRNDGNFSFTPVWTSHVANLYRSSFKFSDFDQDEDLDMFWIGTPGGGNFVKFFSNDGTGNFTEIPAPQELPSKIDSAQFFDVDKDGDDDLLMSLTQEPSYYKTYLYLNNSGTFSRVPAINFYGGQNGGIAVGDIDVDGALDYVIVGSADISSTPSAAVYLNRTNKIPVVSDLQVSGRPILGETLSATYSYFDGDGHKDLSMTNWYRKSEIGGRSLKNLSTDSTYTITTDDIGMYVEFVVIASDGQGSQGNKLNKYMGPIVAPTAELKVVGNEQPVESGGMPSAENNTEFGIVPLSQKMARSYTLKNAGNINLILDTIEISGNHTPNFSILSQIPELIAVGEEVVFSIEFSPSEIGVHNATVSVYSNDSQNEVFSFDISGTGVNYAPVITSLGEVSVSEMHHGTVMDVDATDGERDTVDLGITYSVSGGEDGALFYVAEDTGVVQFLSSPDFEVPKDQDHNNEYLVEVAATDDYGLVSTQLLKITVTDFDEAPIVICVPSFELYLDENGRASLSAEQVDAGSWDDSGNLLLSLSQTEFSCSDIGTKTLILFANDSQQEASCEFSVTVSDVLPPEFVAILDIEVENQPGKANAVVTVPVPEAKDNCQVSAPVGTRSDNKPLEDPYPVGETIISWTVSDTNNNLGEAFQQKVLVQDTEKPQFVSVANWVQATDGGICGALIEINIPEATDNSGNVTVNGVRADEKGLNAIFPVGITEIIWTATDDSENKMELVQKIEVTNASPSAVAITGPSDPLAFGSEFSLTASFSDDNISRATWEASDGTNTFGPIEGQLFERGSSQLFSGLPTGVYTFLLHLEDHCGTVTVERFERVSIFDPEEGYVSGSGSIHSPEGALKGSQVSGKADFSFSAKYKPGSRYYGEVGGNIRFRFKAGDFDFNGNIIEKMSLVISKGYKASFTGRGKINGQDGYSFLVTMIDDEHTGNWTEDYFRIKIWDEAGVLYDNNLFETGENTDPETPVSGGSIVIHKPKGSTKGQITQLSGEAVPESLEGPLVFTAYPNPMQGSAYIEFQLGHSQDVTLALYDMNGREVMQLFRGKAEKGEKYKIQLIKGQLMQGIYFYRLSTDSGRAYQKQLLLN